MRGLNSKLLSRMRELKSPASLRSSGVLVLWGAILAATLAGCGEEKGPAPALDRGTIAIVLAETLDGETTQVNIADLLITRSLLQHGYRLAPKGKARFLVEGTLTCTYFRHTTMTLGGVEQHLQHQWHARFDCTVTDRGEKGKRSKEPKIESFSFPEPLMDGRRDPTAAKRDIRRRAATDMAMRLTRGELLGNPEIPQLLDALLDPYEPRTFNEIEEDLVTQGPAAVPYLIQALTDVRTVRPAGVYLDLKEFNKEELKVYHLADHALSAILDRAEGLDLLSTKDRRLNVITAWSWVWEDAIQMPVQYRTEVKRRETSIPDAGR